MRAIIPVEVVAAALPVSTAIEQGWAQSLTMCPISVHCIIPCQDSLATAAFHNQPVQSPTLLRSSSRLCGLLCSSLLELHIGEHADSARHCEPW